MFQFPFGTMHQLNLDWFLQQWQQLRQDWIDEEQHIEDSMQDVYDARDAAIQAKDDAVSAKNDAESAQAGVHADALMAEGFAVGEQNGTPVGPGSPYYQVNAKFYSINSGTYRYLSEAYARGTMGGTPVDPGDSGYEDNAKYYKEQADLDAQSASDDAAFAAADALKAEGYAVGEQNGVPVSSGDPYYQDNAKYYAAEAQQDKEDADTFKDAANQAALRAEGWSSGTQNGIAVGSDSPYYENNAYYYFSNTANIDGENAQKMIASDEASTTAAADHPTGSYFRMAGKLYVATSDIAIGDTITVGTNCQEAILADDVAELKKAAADYNTAYIVDTIDEQSIAEFSDGTAGTQLKKCIVHVPANREGSGNASPDNIRYYTKYNDQNPVTLKRYGTDENDNLSIYTVYDLATPSIIECDFDMVNGERKYSPGMMYQVVLSGSDQNWSVYTPSGGVRTFRFGVSAIRNLSTSASGITSSHFAPTTSSAANKPDKTVNNFTGNSSNVEFRYSACSSLAEWKQYLDDQIANGTPVILYYKRQAAVTSSQDPVQVATLQGMNHIEPSVGTVDVSYVADAKEYIEKRITAAKNIIAGVEKTYTATKAYASGDLLIVQDTLFKVTAPIANGGTISNGTNVAATTVAEQLILLANT